MKNSIFVFYGDSVDLIFPSGAKITVAAIEDRIGTKNEIVSTDNPDVLNRAGALWSNTPLTTPAPRIGD